ncbi:hypothetical protein K501DRAFT_336920 [Backusella circina FSU 941]|nr:hypothetical protein K501DRAFT_336920 [Backusella circina FSU 941]
MENSKAFLDNDVVGICSEVLNHCNSYILNQTHVSPTQAYFLYSFLPTLLDRILGSPSKRGLIQLDLPPDQINAMLQLLSVNGAFLKALCLLSNLPQYSYELITSNLSASLFKDIGEVLSSGAVQLLPRVYNNTCNTVRSKSDNAFVLRTSATSHSTLLPQSGKDNRTIRFNMLQFYLFHFVSVPTFASTTPSSFTVSKQASYNATTSSIPKTIQTTPLTSMYNNNTLDNNNNNNNVNNTQRQNKPFQYTSSFDNNLNNNSSNSYRSSQPPLLKAGTLTRGPYKNLLRDYFATYIPRNQTACDTFFLDTCIELWIRTISVPSNGKLNDDLMHYITYFIQYIVASDLRREDNVWIYESCHQEIYLLISRLLLNYNDEQYLSVVDLWSIWASPWRFGEAPRSVMPHQQAISFSKVILENVPAYFQLVDIILSKTSRYTFTNMRKASPILSPENVLSIENVDHQIRILHRLNNVLYTDHLKPMLSLMEYALYKIDAGITYLEGATDNPFPPLSRCTGLSLTDLFQRMTSWHGIMTALDGGIFKKRFLYIPNETRFENLMKTVSQIRQAITKMESNSILGVSVLQRKQQVTELKKAEEKLRFVFDISKDIPIVTAPSPTTSKPIDIIKRPASPPQAGLSNGGFLTPEELKLVMEGRLLCSRKNVPKVGRRPRTVVRSYEWGEVLLWTVDMEDRINPWYVKNVPAKWKEKLNLPDQICIRFLAAPINWPYMLAAFILFFYIFRFLFGLLI